MSHLKELLMAAVVALPVTQALAQPAAPEVSATPEVKAPEAPTTPEVKAPEAEVKAPEAAAAIPEAKPLLGLPLTLNGHFWTDTGYMARNDERPGEQDQSSYYMQGRFVLGARYERTLEDYYARSEMSVIGFVNEYSKSQYQPHVLDAYLQFGQDKKWDIQVGRFLAWELYHRGAGIELYTAEEAGAAGAPSMYWLSDTRGHRDESGQAAIHVYPWEHLSLEVASVFGQEVGQNLLGARPVVDLHFGGLKLLAGAEYLAKRPQKDGDKAEQTTKGFGGQLQYVGDCFSVGANFAKATRDAQRIDGDQDSEATLDDWMSTGGFVNFDFWRNSIGLGYHYTFQENGQTEQSEQHQAFLSYLIKLPIDGLAVKAVYGYATAAMQDIDVRQEYENDMQSFRVRLIFDPERLMDPLSYR